MGSFFFMLGLLALCLVPCHAILYISHKNGQLTVLDNVQSIRNVDIMEEYLNRKGTLNNIKFDKCTIEDLRKLPKEFYTSHITQEQILDIQSRPFYGSASLSHVRKTIETRLVELKCSISDGHSYEKGSSSDLMFQFEDGSNSFGKKAKETKDALKEESRSRASSGSSLWSFVSKEEGTWSIEVQSSSESPVPILHPEPLYPKVASGHFGKSLPSRQVCTTTATATVPCDVFDASQIALACMMRELEIERQYLRENVSHHVKDTTFMGKMSASNESNKSRRYGQPPPTPKERKEALNKSSLRKRVNPSDSYGNDKESSSSKDPRQQSRFNVPGIIETTVDRLPPKQGVVDLNRLVPESFLSAPSQHESRHNSMVRFKSTPTMIAPKPQAQPETEYYRGSLMPFSMELPLEVGKKKQQGGKNLSRSGNGWK